MSWEDDIPVNLMADAAETAFGLPPGLTGGVLSFLGGERANSANAAMAQAQMDFQERMSSTAHQREVKDLIAAGLNPMLSARLGGASSPSGASAVMQNTAAPAVTSAQAGAQVSATVENLHAQTKAAEAQAAKSQSEADLNNSLLVDPEGNLKRPGGSLPGGHIQAQVQLTQDMMREITARIKQLEEQGRLTSAQAANARAELPGIHAFARTRGSAAVIAGRDAEVADTWVGRNILPYIRSITGASSAYRNLKD